jgi:hypothetical protein
METRTESGRPGRARSKTGGSPVGPWGVLVVALLLLGAAVILLYSLWAFWPPASSTAATAPKCNCAWFGIHFSLERERSILLIVALAGALGAILHGLRSLSRYVGERYFFRSWIFYYFALPVVGAILGTIVYLVLRAGLISGGGANQDPFGFAALAALVGLFSGQASEKLKQVFETLFSRDEKGTDSLPGSAPVIDAIDKTTASVGDTLTVTGANFVAGATQVSFGATPAEAPTVAQGGTSLTVTVPQGATTGPVTVTTPAGSVTSMQSVTIT